VRSALHCTVFIRGIIVNALGRPITFCYGIFRDIKLIMATHPTKALQSRATYGGDGAGAGVEADSAE